MLESASDGKTHWPAVANRLESYSRYGDAEVQLMTLLSPHICRAITISDVLNLQIIRLEGLGATLNALASGVISPTAMVASYS